MSHPRVPLAPIPEKPSLIIRIDSPTPPAKVEASSSSPLVPGALEGQEPKLEASREMSGQDVL